MKQNDFVTSQFESSSKNKIAQLKVRMLHAQYNLLTRKKIFVV